MDFCNSLDSIDQPDRHRAHECPPEKGFALIMMSAWVMPMFIVPVRMLASAAMCGRQDRLTGLGTVLLQIRCRHQGGRADLLSGRGDLPGLPGQEGIARSRPEELEE